MEAAVCIFLISIFVGLGAYTCQGKKDQARLEAELATARQHATTLTAQLAKAQGSAKSLVYDAAREFFHAVQWEFRDD